MYVGGKAAGCSLVSLDLGREAEFVLGRENNKEGSTEEGNNKSPLLFTCLGNPLLVSLYIHNTPANASEQIPQYPEAP